MEGGGLAISYTHTYDWKVDKKYGNAAYLSHAGGELGGQDGQVARSRGGPESVETLQRLSAGLDAHGKGQTVGSRRNAGVQEHGLVQRGGNPRVQLHAPVPHVLALAKDARGDIGAQSHPALGAAGRVRELDRGQSEDEAEAGKVLIARVRDRNAPANVGSRSGDSGTEKGELATPSPVTWAAQKGRKYPWAPACWPAGAPAGATGRGGVNMGAPAAW